MLTYRLWKLDSCSQTPPTLDFLPDSTNSQKAGNQAPPSRQRTGKKISRNLRTWISRYISASHTPQHRCRWPTQRHLIFQSSGAEEWVLQAYGGWKVEDRGKGILHTHTHTHTHTHIHAHMHTGTYVMSDFSKVTLRALPSDVRGNDFQPRITSQLNPLGAHTKSTLRHAESQSKWEWFFSRRQHFPNVCPSGGERVVEGGRSLEHRHPRIPLHGMMGRWGPALSTLLDPGLVHFTLPNKHMAS